MRILPVAGYVKKPVFSGYTVQDRSAQYNCPDVHLQKALASNKRYDKTLGSYHPNATGKIYYADPLEHITDELREKVDYIFYDDEPRFPDIEKEVSKIYFFEPYCEKGVGNLYTYKNQMDEYRNYFYRMEMADSKFIGHYENKLWNKIDIKDSEEKIAYYKARVSDAKYNQETAAGCIDILKEAQGKIDYKDRIANEISSIKRDIQGRLEEIPKAEKELNNRMQLDAILSSRLESLKEKNRLYSKLQKSLQSSQPIINEGSESVGNIISYNKEHLPHYESYFSYTEFLARPQATGTYEKALHLLQKDSVQEQKEKESIIKQANYIKSSIKECTELAEENKSFIKKAADYKEELPTIIEDLKELLNCKKIEFETVKGELIPYFDKLKNYFYSRGLRQVKY